MDINNLKISPTLILLLILFIYVIGPMLWILVQAIYKRIVPERDLAGCYGPGSWAVITGASRGQGRVMALGLAARGFNLILIGSVRTEKTAEDIRTKYPQCQIIVIVRDFAEALSSNNWWPEIESVFNSDKYDISILINNVGQRSASRPSYTQPDTAIRASLITGTYPQIRLTNLAVEHMIRRSKRESLKPAGAARYKSCILFNTAQCIHPTVGLASYMTGDISVPYLSVYEATNAFGFYHANSLIAEYDNLADANDIHMVNIMPGAVVTENTQYLANTPFAVGVDEFCAGIFRLMGGNWRGATCAYWGHELSAILIGIAPWFRKQILAKVGRQINTALNSQPN